MKAVIEYNLDDQDDRKAHMRCIKATEMAMFIWELRNNMRKKMLNEAHYKGEQDKIDYTSGVLLAWDMLNELYDEHYIDIDKLID